MRIPVCLLHHCRDGRTVEPVVEYAEGPRLEQVLAAPNAEAIRDRAGNLRRVVLTSHGDDTNWRPEHPRGDPRHYSHDHQAEDNPNGVWKLRRLHAR